MKGHSESSFFYDSEDRERFIFFAIPTKGAAGDSFYKCESREKDLFCTIPERRATSISYNSSEEYNKIKEKDALG